MKSPTAITTLACCLVACSGDAPAPTAPRFELAPNAAGSLAEQLSTLRQFVAAHADKAVVVA
ncbi:MAG: hypothetical protein JNN13_05150, partial [Planctomycetes bacterium]|nr:hypothetical protein [Planctomycetota bacterium]